MKKLSITFRKLRDANITSKTIIKFWPKKFTNQIIERSYHLISTLGGDLELSLEVGKVWDRCRWFLYEHHADYQYCSFDLDSDKGTAEVRLFFQSLFYLPGVDVKFAQT